MISVWSRAWIGVVDLPGNELVVCYQWNTAGWNRLETAAFNSQDTMSYWPEKLCFTSRWGGIPMYSTLVDNGYPDELSSPLVPHQKHRDRCISLLHAQIPMHFNWFNNWNYGFIKQAHFYTILQQIIFLNPH